MAEGLSAGESLSLWVLSPYVSWQNTPLTKRVSFFTTPCLPSACTPLLLSTAQGGLLCATELALTSWLAQGCAWGTRPDFLHSANSCPSWGGKWNLGQLVKWHQDLGEPQRLPSPAQTWGKYLKRRAGGFLLWTQWESRVRSWLCHQLWNALSPAPLSPGSCYGNWGELISSNSAWHLVPELDDIWGGVRLGSFLPSLGLRSLRPSQTGCRELQGSSPFTPSLGLGLWSSRSSSRPCFRAPMESGRPAVTLDWSV